GNSVRTTNRRFIAYPLVVTFFLTSSLATFGRNHQANRVDVRVNKAASLPRSSPEQQGISSADILAFVEVADKEIDQMNSLIIVRHGHVVAEGWWAPYDADTPHILFSLSKSFTSTAIGFAVAEGKLNLDDPVLKFF